MTSRNHLNRRTLIGSSAISMLGVAGLRPRGANVFAQDQTTVSWWEHFPEGMNQAIRDAYTQAHPDVTIELTTYAPNEMVQAMQLAYQSDQMPDITSAAGAAGTTIQNLVREGWFQPLPNGEAIRAALPPASLVDGISTFGGQVYSFPIFSFRQYASLNWFNRDLMANAGFDPETGPVTWDEFRAASAKITEGGGGSVYGWIQGINFPDRMAAHLTELAQVAGAAGTIDPLTGGYLFASDPFVQALEFLVSLNADRSLFPASTSLDQRNARARWWAGGAGMLLDGPWNAGVLAQDAPEFLEKVNVAPIPVPDASFNNAIHVGPAAGTYWVAAQSPSIAVVSDLLAQLATPESFVNLAERMDQPPLDLTAVDRADVHPTYRKAMGFFAERVRLAPSPIARNAAVADVIAEMRPVEPDLGAIVVGAFTGDVSDIRGTLQTYQDQMTAERDRAISAVADSGKTVSIDDWIFADWTPGTDYAASSPASPAASPAASPVATPAT